LTFSTSFFPGFLLVIPNIPSVLCPRTNFNSFTYILILFVCSLNIRTYFRSLHTSRIFFSQ
jgi:hypothetical protein